jgi:hypothetical protein
MKSVGQADPHLLQPTESSVLGAEEICLALHPSQGIIYNTSVGQARKAIFKFKHKHLRVQAIKKKKHATIHNNLIKV